MLTAEPPQRVIGQRACDNDALDAELAWRGIERVAPHRSNRRPENITHDGRSPRRSKCRWTAARTIAWLQHLRRLCIRWEKSMILFKGLVHLGCTFLLLAEGLG